MTENMKMLLEIVSEKKELAAKVGGGEYTHGDVRCVCIISGDGNW